jgi:alpha-glucosidase
MDFHCEVSADSMVLHIGKHDGSYPAWWQQIRIEIAGWSPRRGKARLNNDSTGLKLDSTSTGVALSISDDGRGEMLEIE